MGADFLNTTLGRTGWPVCRLGLSASYRPGRQAVHAAIDRGMNFFFAYGFDTQMIGALREQFKTRRRELIIATGGYNWILWRSSLRKSLERRLRQLGTDYLDVFFFMGVMKPEQLPDAVIEEMMRFREEGKVRAIGISTHHRRLAGSLAAAGSLDVLMIRYNAAHRGAETERQTWADRARALAADAGLQPGVGPVARCSPSPAPPPGSPPSKTAGQRSLFSSSSTCCFGSGTRPWMTSHKMAWSTSK